MKEKLVIVTSHPPLCPEYSSYPIFNAPGAKTWRVVINLILFYYNMKKCRTGNKVLLNNTYQLGHYLCHT